MRERRNRYIQEQKKEGERGYGSRREREGTGVGGREGTGVGGREGTEVGGREGTGVGGERVRE